ncbi:MAG: HAD-IIB family hydrolase [Brevinema sp.]
MKRKFLACDIDGTLIHDHQHISDKDLKAIQKFRKAGHYFALCTGRTETWTRPLLEQYHMHCDALILCNGSLLFDVDKNDHLKLTQISSSTLVNSLGKEIINYFYQLGDYTICWDDGKHTYEIADRLMNLTSSIIQEDSTVKISIDDFQHYQNNFITINVAPFVIDFQHSEETKKNMLFRWGDNIDVFRNQHYIDVSPKLSSKGQGILNMVKYLGEEFDLYAVGDSYNDLPMFETVGRSNTFVMENAEKELKTYGDTIVYRVENCIEILLSD